MKRQQKTQGKRKENMKVNVAKMKTIKKKRRNE